MNSHNIPSPLAGEGLGEGLGMTMLEEKPLGFVWGNVYIGMCLIFAVASAIAVFYAGNAIQTNSNPIALLIIVLLYLMTEFGLWKRKKWGLYLTGFTLVLWVSKGIVFVLMGEPVARVWGGVISLIFAMLYGIYFFKRREFFEW